MDTNELIEIQQVVKKGGLTPKVNPQKPGID